MIKRLVLLIFLKLVVADITSHKNWKLFDHVNCGNSLSDRIIGGKEASLGQFPWMAQLGYESRWGGLIFKCGGALINPLYVITAAHCLAELPFPLELIKLGETYTDRLHDCQGKTCAPPVQTFQPAEVHFHRNYNSRSMINDVGLVRMNKKAKLNDYVTPICLPHGPLITKNLIGTVMDVAGWGVTNINLNQASTKLLHVQVPVVSNSICSRAFQGISEMGDKQICAGGRVGQDSCGGDSGGPLMRPEAVNAPPKYYIFGVVSFGAEKCGSDVPAVYTKVSAYLDWILNHIKE